MKLRTMDLILDEHKKGTELITHSVALAQGYKFLCSHISIDRFFADDFEVETPSRNIIACETEEGVNFYAKP